MHKNFIGLTIPIIVLTAIGTAMSLIMVSLSKNIQNNSKVSMWLLSVVLACAMLVLIVIFIVSFKKEQFKIWDPTGERQPTGVVRNPTAPTHQQELSLRVSDVTPLPLEAAGLATLGPSELTRPFHVTPIHTYPVKPYELATKSDSECAKDLIEAAIYYTRHDLN